MKVWMVWLQEPSGYIWLEAAWTDDQTAENHEGWDNEIDRVKKLAYEENYTMQIQKVDVPGVPELFEVPTVKAAALQGEQP